jgi:hypothetical protein
VAAAAASDNVAIETKIVLEAATSKFVEAVTSSAQGDTATGEVAADPSEAASLSADPATVTNTPVADTVNSGIVSLMNEAIVPSIDAIVVSLKPVTDTDVSTFESVTSTTSVPSVDVSGPSPVTDPAVSRISSGITEPVASFDDAPGAPAADTNISADDPVMAEVDTSTAKGTVTIAPASDLSANGDIGAANDIEALSANTVALSSSPVADPDSDQVAIVTIEAVIISLPEVAAVINVTAEEKSEAKVAPVADVAEKNSDAEKDEPLKLPDSEDSVLKPATASPVATETTVNEATVGSTIAPPPIENEKAASAASESSTVPAGTVPKENMLPVDEDADVFLTNSDTVLELAKLGRKATEFIETQLQISLSISKIVFFDFL